jgi:hypothetical protein
MALARRISAILACASISISTGFIADPFLTRSLVTRIRVTRSLVKMVTASWVSRLGCSPASRPKSLGMSKARSPHLRKC